MDNDMGSEKDCLIRYRALRTERPELFRDPANSPIQILTQNDEILAAQAEEIARRKRSNQIAPDVRTGVLASDPYLGMLARDAVRFADRSTGLYNRHIGEAGCVIMPMIGNDIVLIRIFRHAARDWAWEFPGGRISPGEDPDLAAQHELEEEIGATALQMQALGTVHPYPAFSSACIHLYIAFIQHLGAPQIAEGIASIDRVTLSRLFEMVEKNEITDASALACILKARMRGFI